MSAGKCAPVVAAWGAGTNSTAMIIELVRRGEIPDMTLLAAMPEQPHTRRLIPVFRQWMDDHGVSNEIVEYQARFFKHWPPYTSLLDACLTNGTLPSISFGQHSCSARHKISPQDKWVKAWPPAQHAWASGHKVVRLIGYDCSTRDNQRYAHREEHISDLYEYRYPLREWGFTREDCERIIAEEGLPPFHKSSCFFCGAMQISEVRALPREELRLIVLLEARAAPRLRTVEGLWRKSTKKRPGSMSPRSMRSLPTLPSIFSSSSGLPRPCPSNSDHISRHGSNASTRGWHILQILPTIRTTSEMQVDVSAFIFGGRERAHSNDIDHA
ncbi:hypothetical protein [Sphingobium terrigena]|uniref:hypothetical protein n=1 Tax=Sphingobium terrigena TaxID=2304063 RepID=UPI001EF114DA|nr:hypothetical protein [Sphingobium terrigena]